MTTLKVGIASYEEMEARTMSVARGERRIAPNAPPLRNPELFTLSNDGMMLAGFEEVGGHRLYQGWWIRFE